MFSKKVNEYEGMTKEELKERLQIIDYEIASTRNKSKLKKFSKEAEMISNTGDAGITRIKHKWSV